MLKILIFRWSWKIAGFVWFGAQVTETPASSPDSTATDWVTFLFDRGILGVILFLILIDRMGPHGERNRLREELAKERELNKDASLTMQNEVIPAVVRMTDLGARMLDRLDASSRRRVQ